MKIHINSIKNKGIFEDEVVALSVAEDDDIGKYMLSDSTYTESGSLSNKIRHIYWFPDKTLKKGDFVWLYSRPRRSDDKREWTNKSRTTTHAFYWGLPAAVWNDEGDFAVLLKLNTWESRKTGAE